MNSMIIAVNLGILIANCLLLTNCIKIYTEVVKYKIFQSKKEVV